MEVVLEALGGVHSEVRRRARQPALQRDEAERALRSRPLGQQMVQLQAPIKVEPEALPDQQESSPLAEVKLPQDRVGLLILLWQIQQWEDVWLLPLVVLTRQPVQRRERQQVQQKLEFLVSEGQVKLQFQVERHPLWTTAQVEEGQQAWEAVPQHALQGVG